MSKWDEYGTKDPDAPWNREYPRAFNRRKKTNKWCKGKVGVKHEYALKDRWDCFWEVKTNTYVGRYPNWKRGIRAIWRCGCQLRCVGCNKHSWTSSFYGDCLHLDDKVRTRPKADEYEMYHWR